MTKRVDKYCEDCGTLLVNVPIARRLCRPCAIKRQAEYQREYRKKRREQKEAKGVTHQVPTVNPNKKYCKDCVYWGCRHYVGNSCCNYIFIEGHSRGCPPGKDCTKKVVGKRKRTMEFGESKG